MAYGIDFLFLVGQQGELVEGQLRLEQEAYAAFFAKSPRLKKKFIKGMAEVGLAVTEQDDAVMVEQYTVSRYDAGSQGIGGSVCATDAGELGQVSVCTLRFPGAWMRTTNRMRWMCCKQRFRLRSMTHIIDLHHDLAEMAYKPTSKIDGIFGWKIQYQGNRKIKASPFFEFEYDERLRTSACYAR